MAPPKCRYFVPPRHRWRGLIQASLSVQNLLIVFRERQVRSTKSSGLVPRSSSVSRNPSLEPLHSPPHEDHRVTLPVVIPYIDHLTVFTSRCPLLAKPGFGFSIEPEGERRSISSCRFSMLIVVAIHIMLSVGRWRTSGVTSGARDHYVSRAVRRRSNC